MLFDDDLDAIFGRPYDRRDTHGTTRGLFRHIARHNPKFRTFSRNPLGKAALNTATLLARLSMERFGREDAQNPFEDASEIPMNTATQSGRMISRDLRMAGADIALDLLDGLLSQALQRRKVTTSVSESGRSQEAQKLWKSSRSDRDAELARILLRGQGQL